MLFYVIKHSGQNFISFVFLYFLLCYALCFQTSRSKFHFLCFPLFCYAMHSVSKNSGQYFIFFVFLYLAMLCYVSKHSGQNFISFVFLYFAICYALRYISKHGGHFFPFVFLWLCFGAMFWNIAKHSTLKTCGVSLRYYGQAQLLYY